jgi:hypothetical protein
MAVNQTAEPMALDLQGEGRVGLVTAVGSEGGRDYLAF